MLKTHKCEITRNIKYKDVLRKAHKMFLMAVKGSEFPICITASNSVEMFSATNVESHPCCVAGWLYESQSPRTTTSRFSQKRRTH